MAGLLRPCVLTQAKYERRWLGCVPGQVERSASVCLCFVGSAFGMSPLSVYNVILPPITLPIVDVSAITHAHTVIHKG